MRVEVTDDAICVRLARWEKVLGLMGDIRIPLADVTDVQVVPDGVRDAMSGGLKAGLRLPWRYYVCRSLRLDRAWAVRRGPALKLTVRDQHPLTQVTVSSPDADALAERIRQRDTPTPTAT